MSEQHARRRRLTRRALIGVGASAALATVGLAGTTASAAPPPQIMTVHMGGGPVKGSTHDLTAGWTTFEVTSASVHKGDSGAQVASLRPGVTLDQLTSDLEAAGGFGAAFTTAVSDDAILYGGADVQNGVPGHFSLDLAPGQYYLVDVDQQVHTVAEAFPFTVHPSTTRSHAPASHGTVLMKDMRFHPSSNDLPADNTITLTNSRLDDADDIHFMLLLPVVPGTTDKEIQAYFDHPAGPPTFVTSGPTAQSEILSPGESMQFSYDLPPGTYAMFCFITDPETGMEHAAMGMHKVVTLS